MQIDEINKLSDEFITSRENAQEPYTSWEKGLIYMGYRAGVLTASDKYKESADNWLAIRHKVDELINKSK